MEVAQELKKLYKESFLDNFYLWFGLFFIVIFQLVRDYIKLCIRFFNFLMTKHEEKKQTQIKHELKEVKKEKSKLKKKEENK